MSKFNSIYKLIKKSGWQGMRLYISKRYDAKHSHDRQVYRWVDKKLGKVIDADLRWEYEKEAQIYKDCIWMCWLQGIDNAPEIVKRCYESVVKHANGHRVIMLDYDSIQQYVDLPEYIYEKFEKKVIPNAFFCDILRIVLLEKYGGVWMDSTLYLTGDISERYFRVPLFCFQASILQEGPIKGSNWFLAAEPYNEIIRRVKNALLAYWNKKNVLIDYYIFHYCFSRAVNSNDNTRGMWAKMEYYNNVNPHILQFELGENFDLERWEYIKSISWIHKLTYKENDNPNSYYNYIVRGEI